MTKIILNDQDNKKLTMATCDCACGESRGRKTLENQNFVKKSCKCKSFLLTSKELFNVKNYGNQ